MSICEGVERNNCLFLMVGFAQDKVEHAYKKKNC